MNKMIQWFQILNKKAIAKIIVLIILSPFCIAASLLVLAYLFMVIPAMPYITVLVIMLVVFYPVIKDTVKKLID